MHPLLTPSKIEDIVSCIPQVYSANEKLSVLRTEEIKKNLRYQLKNIRLVDNPDALKEFKQRIVIEFLKSSLRPGESIGLVTSEAVAQPTTQINLKAPRSAGTISNVSQGITAISRLLSASERGAANLITVHFKQGAKNFTYYETLDIAQKLVGVTTSYLTDDSITIHEINNFDKSIPWFIDKKHPTNSKYFIQLKFNVDKLLEHDISMGDLYEHFSSTKSIICYCSPTYKGIINLFTTKTNDNDKWYELSQLKDYVDKISKEYIKIEGEERIEGILHPSLVVRCVASLVREQIDNGRVTWWYDKYDMRISGVTPQMIKNLGLTIGMTVISEDTEKIVFNPTKRTTEPPTAYINEYIKVFNDQQCKFVDEKDQVQELVFDDIYRASQYIYVVYQGVTPKTTGFYSKSTPKGSGCLRKLICHPLVNPKYTISNNVNEIVKVLGIAAARNFISRELSLMIAQSGAHIGARFSAIIADYMTFRGVIVAFTAKGSEVGGSGVFPLASYNNPGQRFIRAAAVGKTNPINVVADCIFTGRRAPIGTGFVTLSLNQEVKRKIMSERGDINVEIFDPVYKIPPIIRGSLQLPKQLSGIVIERKRTLKDIIENHRKPTDEIYVAPFRFEEFLSQSTSVSGIVQVLRAASSQ